MRWSTQLSNGPPRKRPPTDRTQGADLGTVRRAKTCLCVSFAARRYRDRKHRVRNGDRPILSLSFVPNWERKRSPHCTVTVLTGLCRCDYPLAPRGRPFRRREKPQNEEPRAAELAYP